MHTSFHVETNPPLSIIPLYLRLQPGDWVYAVRIVVHEQQHFGVEITKVNQCVMRAVYISSYMVLIDR